MKEIFIKITDEGKEMEMNISQPSKETEQALLSGILGFFNIDVNRSMPYIQKLYEDFYDGSFNPEIIETNESIKEPDYRSMTSQQLFELGIKISPHDKIMYRCHYICTSCGDEGNRYIDPRFSSTTCHKCKERLFIKTPEVSPDEFGNHYHAGDYK